MSWRPVWKDTNRQDGKPGPWRKVWKKIVPKAPKRKYGARGTVGPAVRFTWSETECSDGTPVPVSLRGRVAAQARYLNQLRSKTAKHYGLKFSDVSINVNSWYRTPAYNTQIGGAKNSQHVHARATDITVVINPPGRKPILLTPRKVAELAESVPAFRYGGIGWYDAAHGSFTHVDHRDGAARWING